MACSLKGCERPCLRQRVHLGQGRHGGRDQILGPRLGQLAFSVQTRFFLVCLFRFRWLACAPAQCAEKGESRNLAFKRPPRFRNQNFGLQAICRSNQNLLTASTRNKQMFKINKVLYVVLHFIFSGTRKFSSSFKTPPKQQSFFQHILMP